MYSFVIYNESLPLMSTDWETQVLPINLSCQVELCIECAVTLPQLLPWRKEKKKITPQNHNKTKKFKEKEKSED